MFDYCKRREIINDLSNVPKGFIKSKNYVEVECCEFADELKVPVTSSGYLLCSKHLTANGKEICRSCGIFRGFYGYCTDKGNIVKKKFELPEDDKFIASDNFNLFENGIKIGFVNGEFILSLSCKDFESLYNAEDTSINEYFQDSIAFDRCIDDQVSIARSAYAEKVSAILDSENNVINQLSSLFAEYVRAGFPLSRCKRIFSASSVSEAAFLSPPR